MLRPLAADILQSVLPVVVAALVFIGGRTLHRGPRWLRFAIIGLGLILFLFAASSLVRVLQGEVTSWLSLAGGATVFLSWVALLFLGIVWSVPKRSLSPVFLVCLMSVAGLLIVVETSGWIWWRFGMHDLWEHRADEEGCLRQSSGLTCSPAAAVMLLHRYGIDASEGEMAYLANTSIFGTEVQGMARALTRKLEHQGLKAHVSTQDYHACLQNGRPFIAHIRTARGGHAIYVEKIETTHVHVIDPIEGRRNRMHRGPFELVWQGLLIEIVPD